MYYLAIDVGGTFTKYAIITEKCEILKKSKQKTEQQSLDMFLESIVGIFDKVKTQYGIKGIALSMPGMIDSKKGFMYTGGNLNYITNLNIVEVIQHRCNIPVTVENDGKCAAFAELWQGSLKDIQDAVVIVCGTGIGGAVIRNREVLNGKHFMAGEFSYVLTESNQDYSMELCLADNTGIQSLLNFVAEQTGVSVEGLSGEQVFSMAESGDDKAITGIRKYAKHIAVQIHNYQYILDPERFAIGGGISIQPLLLQLIREEVEKINAIFPWELPIPEVVSCKYFNDANLIGAVYVHLRSTEKRINLDKVYKLLEMIDGSRAGEYLRALIME